MKEGRGDKVTELVIQRRGKLSDFISSEFKSQKPFASEQLPVKDQIWAIDSIGTQDIVELEQEFGREALNTLFYQVEKRRNRNA